MVEINTIGQTNSTPLSKGIEINAGNDFSFASSGNINVEPESFKDAKNDMQDPKTYWNHIMGLGTKVDAGIV